MQAFGAYSFSNVKIYYLFTYFFYLCKLNTFLNFGQKSSDFKKSL